MTSATSATFRPGRAAIILKVYKRPAKAHAEGRQDLPTAEHVPSLLSQGHRNRARRPASGVCSTPVSIDRLVYSKLAARARRQLHRGAVCRRCAACARLGHFLLVAGVTVYEGLRTPRPRPDHGPNLPDALRGHRRRPSRASGFGCRRRRVAVPLTSSGSSGSLLAQPAGHPRPIRLRRWFHTGDIVDIADDGYVAFTSARRAHRQNPGGQERAPACSDRAAALVYHSLSCGRRSASRSSPLLYHHRPRVVSACWIGRRRPRDFRRVPTTPISSFARRGALARTRQRGRHPL